MVAVIHNIATASLRKFRLVAGNYRNRSTERDKPRVSEFEESGYVHVEWDDGHSIHIFPIGVPSHHLTRSKLLILVGRQFPHTYSCTCNRKSRCDETNIHIWFTRLWVRTFWNRSISNAMDSSCLTVLTFPSLIWSLFQHLATIFNVVSNPIGLCCVRLFIGSGEFVAQCGEGDGVEYIPTTHRLDTLSRWWGGWHGYHDARLTVFGNPRTRQRSCGLQVHVPEFDGRDPLQEFEYGSPSNNDGAIEALFGTCKPRPFLFHSIHSGSLTFVWGCHHPSRMSSVRIEMFGIMLFPSITLALILQRKETLPIMLPIVFFWATTIVILQPLTRNKLDFLFVSHPNTSPQTGLPIVEQPKYGRWGCLHPPMPFP